MRRIGSSALTAALVLAAVVSAADAASTPTTVGFAVCPRIMETTYPPAGVGVGGPGEFGCGPIVSSSRVFLQPDNTCTTQTNTDLGTFLTAQNPLGAYVGIKSPDSCATNPPTMGGVVEGGAFTVNVAQTGFCPTNLTIPAQTTPFGGPRGSVVLPIGSLPLGSYRVSVDFPDQTVFNPRSQQSTTWIGSRAIGTLHVGTTFTETVTSALARAGSRDTLAVLLSNSAAGPGAGELLSTRTADPSIRGLTATEYYACGTISFAATATYGKRGANGVVRLTGNGNITGGSGNYTGLKGAFTLAGKFSAKTNRGTFVLRGTAKY